MEEGFVFVELKGRAPTGEEITSLKVTPDEYKEIISKYGTDSKTVRLDNGDEFQKAQEMALPGEELSRLYTSTPQTYGFERGLVSFTRLLTLMQDAMLKHQKFRAVIHYDAEKFRTGVYIYTPKESGEGDKPMEDLSE